MGTLDIITSIADVSVAIAYFAIPGELWYFNTRLSTDLPAEFKQVLWLFVLFITCCGLTHVIMSFHPYYPTPVVNCLAKTTTGIVSLYTAYALIGVIPRALYYPIYTQSIEHENLERQVHERYLQENVNIFRRIRQYTEIFTNRPLQYLYDDLMKTFHDKLGVQCAIYIISDTNDYVRKSCSPTDLVRKCPERVGNGNDNTIDRTGFTGRWWLIYFDPGYDDYTGFVTLYVDQVETVITTRKNLVFGGNGNENEGSLLLPETEATVVPDLPSKPYFNDIIIDVIDHFESNLSQTIARNKNTDLIEQLKSQNELLQRARAESQVIAKQSNDWLSVMSHEMRTPLFAIESLSEMLYEKTQEDENLSMIKSSVDLINQSAKHLSEIINNVLDFTKIEDDQYQLEETDFDLKQIVSEAFSVNIQNDRRLYPHCYMFFDDCLPNSIRGDPIRIKQIFLNIFNNAVKFTPDEGYVHASISCRDGNEGSLRLVAEIKDTGIGIKKEDESKIFQQFSQSDASITRKFGGTGLGLSICKKLCRMMNGDIWFHSNIPQGTVFVVEIEVKRGDPELSSSLNLRVPEEIKDWKICVLDGMEMGHMCTTKHLRNLGFEKVTSTYDCDMLDIADADVYIIDCRIPCLQMDRLTKWLASKDIILQTSLYLRRNTDYHSPNEVLQPTCPRDVYETMTRIAVQRKLIPLTKVERKKETYNVHLLVAEDNKINQTVIGRILAKLGMTADFADDGEIAVDLFRKEPNRYKIILMDIMMPNMDGYTATKEIRKLSGNRRSPYIIALTANAFWEDRVKANECGMNDFLTKPMKIDQLKVAIEKSGLV